MALPLRTNNFPAAVDQISREIARYYLVGYTTPVNDVRLHKIDVKVARSGVTVRAALSNYCQARRAMARLSRPYSMRWPRRISRRTTFSR